MRETRLRPTPPTRDAGLALSRVDAGLALSRDDAGLVLSRDDAGVR
jgi:hypothetical protein